MQDFALAPFQLFSQRERASLHGAAAAHLCLSFTTA